MNTNKSDNIDKAQFLSGIFFHLVSVIIFFYGERFGIFTYGISLAFILIGTSLISQSYSQNKNKPLKNKQ